MKICYNLANLCARTKWTLSAETCDLLYALHRGKKGFTSKRIVLFSNVCHKFGDDQLNDIIGSLKEAEIELDVM